MENVAQLKEIMNEEELELLNLGEKSHEKTEEKSGKKSKKQKKNRKKKGNFFDSSSEDENQTKNENENLDLEKSHVTTDENVVTDENLETSDKSHVTAENSTSEFFEKTQTSEICSTCNEEFSSRKFVKILK